MGFDILKRKLLPLNEQEINSDNIESKDSVYCLTRNPDNVVELDSWEKILHQFIIELENKTGNQYILKKESIDFKNSFQSSFDGLKLTRNDLRYFCWIPNNKNEEKHYNLLIQQYNSENDYKNKKKIFDEIKLTKLLMNRANHSVYLVEYEKDFKPQKHHFNTNKEYAYARKKYKIKKRNILKLISFLKKNGIIGKKLINGEYKDEIYINRSFIAFENLEKPIHVIDYYYKSEMQDFQKNGFKDGMRADFFKFIEQEHYILNNGKLERNFFFKNEDNQGTPYVFDNSLLSDVKKYFENNREIQDWSLGYDEYIEFQ